MSKKSKNDLKGPDQELKHAGATGSSVLGCDLNWINGMVGKLADRHFKS